MTEPTNFILYIQLTGYCIAAILSLCITIPMSMHQDNFKGHCLLFTTGEWREKDGQFVVDWASQAYCNFTIFVGVVMFVISATQIYRYIGPSWKSPLFHQEPAKGKKCPLLKLVLDGMREHRFANISD